MPNGAFRTYFVTFLSLMPRKAAVALGVAVCLSLSEGAGLLLIVPLLQLAGLDVQQGAMGRISDFVSSVFAAIGIRPTLVSVLAIYVLIVTIHALLARWQVMSQFDLEHDFVFRLRQNLYRAIANTHWLFFSKCRAADLTHALTAALDRIDLAMYYLFTMLSNSIITVIYLVLALQLSVGVTLLVLSWGGILFFILRGQVQAARLSGERSTLATKALHAAISEHLASMKTTKSYGVQDRHVAMFLRMIEQLRPIYSDMRRTSADAKSWFDIGSAVILGCTLYVAIEYFSTSTATILVLIFLFFRIMPRLSGIQQGLQYFVNMLPTFAWLMQLQAACEAAAEPRPGRSEDVGLGHSIRLERVSFSYEGTDGATLIDDLELLIEAGRTTAIVGPSGAGKSTIADLVIGLIQPHGGRVLVDGLPLSPERMKSWRDQIGYVAQDTFLFHDTIRANLLWARPDASEEIIWEALRLAAAHEFVAGFSDGLDTVVGDRGVRLSGGERQRLALARAVLREPSLLLLDEATSSLDSENERSIQGAIEQLHGQMTIVVITHRLSTIRRADVIHVLERGRLVQSGDWDLLVAQDGRFRELCRAQGIDVETRCDRDNGSSPVLRTSRMDTPSSGHDAPAGRPS